MIDFKNISYLKSGNSRQKQAYETLINLDIFNDLYKYCPILCGTIPIEIDLPNSDLDIICNCEDIDEFAQLLMNLYKNKKGFSLRFKTQQGLRVVVAEFKTDLFVIEIFGQNKFSDKQNAYLHMLIEYEILQQKGEEFRKEIIQLKEAGLKTEPAFAQLLGFKGDPYEELLNIVDF